MTIGLGEEFRGLISAMTGSAIPFAIRPYSKNMRSVQGEPFMPERTEIRSRYDVNIIGSTPFGLPRMFAAVGPELFQKSYNIQRVFWELEKAPAEWAEFFDSIDELWAPNRFVADAYRHAFTGPITIVPPFVDVDPLAFTNAAPVMPKTGRFRFFYNFDYNSKIARKNPMGAIEAFRRAFVEDRDDVELMVKSVGHFPPDYPDRAVVEAACAGDKRIILIHQSMSRAEALGLIGSCDCYVSLHRAEGLGLGMCEAMLFGKPVIGTDYSGSTDFLNADTGFPVGYRLRALEPDEYFHGDGQYWAEPDIGHAAELMRVVVDDAELAAQKAEAGRRYVSRKYGKANVRASIEARLAEIGRIPDLSV
ncbi:MAG: glycosyltransferase family 4 protein [Salaquimonas sp.]|nr:glycosyltransferase family 4 protein [Salaquimonas sp.]